MSSVIILHLLRANKLEDYFPTLLCNGFHKVETLTSLSRSDLERLNIKSERDQDKILDLAQEAIRIFKEQVAAAKLNPPQTSTPEKRKKPNPGDVASLAEARRRRKEAAASSQNKLKRARIEEKLPSTQENTNLEHKEIQKREPEKQTATASASAKLKHNNNTTKEPNIANTYNAINAANTVNTVNTAKNNNGKTRAVPSQALKEPIPSDQNTFDPSFSVEVEESTIQSSQQKSDSDSEELSIKDNSGSTSPLSPFPLRKSTTSTTTIPKTTTTSISSLSPLSPSSIPSNNITTSTTKHSLESFFENKTEKLGPISFPQPEIRKRSASYVSSIGARQNKQSESDSFSFHTTTSVANNNNHTKNSKSNEINTIKNPRRLTTNFTPLHQQTNFEDYSIPSSSSSQPRATQKKAPLLDSYGIPVSKKKQTETNTTAQEPPLQRSGSFQNQLSTESNDRLDKQLGLGQKISVCVRKRPLNSKERELNDIDIAHISGTNTINVNAPKQRIDLSGYTEEYPFTFDETFDSNISTKEVYKRTAKPLVNFIFRGGKATCFAYGQTGSGKTYTMLHPKDGLYIQAANDVFQLLSMEKYSHLSVHLSFYEIYQNQIYDLLNNKMRLSARADRNNNVIIAGLKEIHVNSVNELMKRFEMGAAGRTTGQTGANNLSSRSHAILQIVLKDGNSKSHGKFSFIDLAGSERGQDRGESDPKTRMEGAEINKSLLALKECIRALDQSQKHTPFRGSKLTHVLRDSFVGSSRTCMIANISPNSSNSEHTLNTLRYADRVKELKGQSDPRLLNKQNIDSSDLDELQRTHSENEEMDGEDDETDEMEGIMNEEEKETAEDEEEVDDLIYQENGELDFLAMQRAYITKLERYIKMEKNLLDDYTQHHKLSSRDEYERYLRASKNLKWDVTDTINDVWKRIENELRYQS